MATAAAKTATDFLAEAVTKAAAALRLANHPGFWLSEPAKSTVTLGDGTLWITGTATRYLVGGWDQFGKDWLGKNPGWGVLAVFGLPPTNVLALMVRDAAKIIEDGARVDAAKAETAKQVATGNVRAKEIELGTLNNAPDARVSVYWDKSTRDHVEPLDS